MTGTTWRAWRDEFEIRARRPLPPIDDTTEIPVPWRAPLAASLAVFQVGEAGEGRIAREIDGARLPAIDDDYRAALKLFVREEGRHARILAVAVRALGRQTIDRQWTERLFQGARRLMGLRLKILVLLSAELVGGAMYGALAARLPDGALARALRQIGADEDRHLAFHVDFLRRTTCRAAVVPAWLGIGAAAAVVVLWDHRRTLRALDLPLPALAVRFARALVGVAACLAASPSPSVRPGREVRA
jgi:hypothetical protein